MILYIAVVVIVVILIIYFFIIERKSKPAFTNRYFVGNDSRLYYYDEKGDLFFGGYCQGTIGRLCESGCRLALTLSLCESERYASMSLPSIDPSGCVS